MARMIAKNKNISKLILIKNKKVRHGYKYLYLLLALIILIPAGLLFASVILVNSYISEVPSKEKIQAILSERTENSKIYDRHGNLLYIFKDPHQDREYADFVEIPPSVIVAALAAEDKDFFIHSGIDYIASVNGLITSVFSDQRVGGSTITQQLIKQTVLSSKQTIDRKIKEALIATILEEDYSKVQILEYYLNSSSFGGRVVGIKTAAQAYFNKPLSKITLNEAAFLMALVRSPGEYSPLFAKDTELALNLVNQRRKFILDQIQNNSRLIHYWQTKNMEVLKEYVVSEDKITAQVRKEITDLHNKNVTVRATTDILQAPHWVFYIRDILAKAPYNLSLNELYNGGYSIHTSLDLNLQNIAQQEVARGVANNGWRYGFQNASLVMVSAETGEILVMVGSKGYSLPKNPNNKKFDPKTNAATSLQLLGSSLKPWVAYLAFETGWYNDRTIVPDTPQTFFGGYRPRNADGRFLGSMDIRRALLLSRNLPFLKISNNIGAWKLPELMKKIGYRPNNNYGLAATIGGVDETLLDHTGAYTGFANGGRVMQLKPILKIVNQDNKVVFNAKTTVKHQLNGRAVAMVNNILGDKSYRPGGYAAKFIGGQKVAGKSGTTDKNKDNLYMGYGPKFVTGVWVGNNDNSNLAGNAYGLNTALPIWNSFMRRAFAVAPWLGVYGRY
jgi:penicillin-binding protein 1A